MMPPFAATASADTTVGVTATTLRSRDRVTVYIGGTRPHGDSPRARAGKRRSTRAFQVGESHAAYLDMARLETAAA